MKYSGLDLHLKQINGLAHLTLIDKLESPQVYESLEQVIVVVGLTLVQLPRHTSFQDFYDTSHQEEVAVLKFVFSLVVSEGAESEEILNLSVVRPVLGRFKEFLSVGDSGIVGIYPLIKDAVQELSFKMGT
jgi:hypothetical protein